MVPYAPKSTGGTRVGAAGRSYCCGVLGAVVVGAPVGNDGQPPGFLVLVGVLVGVLDGLPFVGVGVLGCGGALGVKVGTVGVGVGVGLSLIWSSSGSANSASGTPSRAGFMNASQVFSGQLPPKNAFSSE
jgi:hypothetical protein